MNASIVYYHLNHIFRIAYDLKLCLPKVVNVIELDQLMMELHMINVIGFDLWIQLSFNAIGIIYIVFLYNPLANLALKHNFIRKY